MDGNCFTGHDSPANRRTCLDAGGPPGGCNDFVR